LTTVAGENAGLDQPSDVALGPDGLPYVADAGSQTVKRVWPDGRVTNYVALPEDLSYGSYAGFLLGFVSPVAFSLGPERPKVRLAINAEGDLIASSSAGTLVPGIILGIPHEAQLQPGFASVIYGIRPNGEATAIKSPALGLHASIDWLSDGRILTGSETLDQLFSLTTDGVERIAGAGAEGSSGDGGPATAARLRAPQSVAALSTGEIYVADQERVRLVRPDGVIEAADATRPEAYLASDATDSLYIAGEEELLRRTAGGAVETVAVAADCTDCGQPAAIVLRPRPYVFGRIAATPSGIWVQARNTVSPPPVLVSREGEFVPHALARLPFPLGAFGPIAQRLGADAQGGLILATGGLLYSLGPNSDEWQQVPGSAGFARGNVLHSLRTEAGDVYFTLEDRVMRLTAEGSLNTVAGLEPDSPLQTPSALALTAEGDLLIADSAAAQVFVLRSPGECDRTVRPQIYAGGVFNAAGPVGGYPNILFNGIGGITFASPVLLPAPFAPGMIASAFGVRLASGEAAAYDRGASSVPAELAGVSATADGRPVGIPFASDGQLNLVLPFDLPEAGEVDLVVTVDSVPSEPYRLTMGLASPGVLAVLNADGSVNADGRPAKVGDEVSLLVSGLGRPEGEVDALQISDDVIPWPTEDLTIVIPPADAEAADLAVQPLWARSRPGEIASLVEVRFRIPEGAAAKSEGVDAVLLRGGATDFFDLSIVR
jgi:uncharacterized protein (TIGR03437 family)